MVDLPNASPADFRLDCAGQCGQTVAGLYAVAVAWAKGWRIHRGAWCCPQCAHDAVLVETVCAQEGK